MYQWDMKNLEDEINHLGDATEDPKIERD